MTGENASLALFFAGASTGVVEAPFVSWISAIPNGRWSHVVVDFDARAPNPHVTALVDGSATVLDARALPPTLDAPTVTLGVVAGLEHTTACTVSFDDFVFDAD